MKTEQLDQAASIGLKTAVLGFLTTLFGNWKVEEAVAVGGFVITVAGFIVILVFKIRSDRRQQVLFELRKQRLQAGMTDHSRLGGEDDDE